MGKNGNRRGSASGHIKTLRDARAACRELKQLDPSEAEGCDAVVKRIDCLIEHIENPHTACCYPGHDRDDERVRHIETIRAADSVCHQLGKAGTDKSELRGRLKKLKKTVEHPHLRGRLWTTDANGLARALDYYAKVGRHTGDLDEDKWDTLIRAKDIIADLSDETDAGDDENRIVNEQEVIEAAVTLAEAMDDDMPEAEKEIEAKARRVIEKSSELLVREKKRKKPVKATNKKLAVQAVEKEKKSLNPLNLVNRKGKGGGK